MKGKVSVNHKMAVTCTVLVAAVLLMASLCIAGVRWTANGINLCTTGVENVSPQVAPDGSGGAIITWEHYLAPPPGLGYLYAQRVAANGDSQWATDGVVLGSFTMDLPGAINVHRMVSDGFGGAIITWMDYPWGDTEIHAQRVDSNGNPLWGTNGVTVRKIAGSAGVNPRIAADGSGGAIITWEDFRNGDIHTGEGWGVYAQRVDASGNLQWAANGIAVCDIAGGDSQIPQIASDGSGGAIITWVDFRSGSSEVYVQRVDSSGNPQWAANGVLLTLAGVLGFHPEITSDGSGGAIITWEDERGGLLNIFAQKIDHGGNTQWAASGAPVRNLVAKGAFLPQIISDGSGGAVVTWADQRDGLGDIYVQKVDSGGNAQWTANGVALRQDAGSQAWPPVITADGTGGAIVSWGDPRSGQWNVYVQGVDSNGSLLWAANGVEMRDNGLPNDARVPQLAHDGSGGAIVAWSDDRSGVTWEVFAQRLSRKPPTVNGISPSSGANDCITNITDLSGTGFFAVDYGDGLNNPIVRLRKNGEADITAGGVNVSPDGTRITCGFDLTGAAVGAWDVYVENPDGQSGTLASGFQVSVQSLYFAEGYTGVGYQEYLCLFNPRGEDSFTRITYMFADGAAQVQDILVPAESRVTVDVNAVVGPDKEVSAKVDSSQPIVGERPMYFSYRGAWTGGHVVVGASSPATAWYFAEGYTGDGFDEYICVQNPGEGNANLTFRFQTQEEGEKVVSDYVVMPHSRQTFKVNDLLGEGYQASLKLEASQPVVAERPMYFDYMGTTGDRGWTGGHCVMGAPSLSSEYYFAEGTTREGFETWLTIQNTDQGPITVDAFYQLGDGQGTPVERSYDVAAGTRLTVYLPDEVGEGVDVSAHLASSSQFLAERPTYFSYDQAGLSADGGHCVIGVPAPSQEWFFAEGYTGDSNSFDTWLCLQNPGDSGAQVQVTYYAQDQGPLPPQDLVVPAKTRVSLLVNDQIGADYQLSIKVTSDKPIVAERPMYFDYDGINGGHDDVGYKIPVR